MHTFVLSFLLFSASVVDALSVEEIFRRQADPTCTSCTTFTSTIQNCGTSVTCDCTTAVEALAQTCINCLVSISAAPGAIQNVTTDYNTLCQLSNVAKVTIPGHAASTAGPTSSAVQVGSTAAPSQGTKTSVFDGPPSSSSAVFSSTAISTPTGGITGNITDTVPSPVPETTISLAGAPGPSTTSVPDSIGDGSTANNSSGQNTGSQAGPGSSMSGSLRTERPSKTGFVGGIVVAVAAVIFFG